MQIFQTMSAFHPELDKDICIVTADVLTGGKDSVTLINHRAAAVLYDSPYSAAHPCG